MLTSRIALFFSSFSLMAASLPADNIGESLASSHNLPICYLATTNPIVSDRKVPCTLQVSYPSDEHHGSTNLLKGNVRIHGGVSQSYPKKSFGVTLESPLQFPGLHTGAHWVLNAAYIDRSLMRHKLAYDLFMSLASTNAPR